MGFRVRGVMKVLELAASQAQLDGFKVRASKSGSDLETTAKAAGLTLEASDKVLYFRAKMMGYDLPNGNGDAVSRVYAAHFGPSFIGKQLNVNHQSDPEHIIGRILTTFHVEQPLTLTAADERIIGRNVLSGIEDAEAKELQLEGICMIDRTCTLGDDMAKKLLAGTITMVSQEAYTEYAECSVCAHKMQGPRATICGHLEYGSLMIEAYQVPGKAHKVLAYKDHKNPIGEGLAIVNVGAYSKADILDLVAKAKTGATTVDEAQGILAQQEELFGRNTLLMAARQELAAVSTVEAALAKLNGVEALALQSHFQTLAAPTMPSSPKVNLSVPAPAAAVAQGAAEPGVAPEPGADQPQSMTPTATGETLDVAKTPGPGDGTKAIADAEKAAKANAKSGDEPAAAQEVAKAPEPDKVAAKLKGGKTVKYQGYTIEETADGNFITKDPKGSRVEGPPLASVETSKKYVDLDIRDKRPKVKAGDADWSAFGEKVDQIVKEKSGGKFSLETPWAEGHLTVHELRDLFEQGMAPEAVAEKALAGLNVKASDLRHVRVTFDDGDTLDTNMASGVSDEEIRKYYAVGQEFNLGSGENDRMAKVVKVEILASVKAGDDFRQLLEDANDGQLAAFMVHVEGDENGFVYENEEARARAASEDTDDGTGYADNYELADAGADFLIPQILERRELYEPKAEWLDRLVRGNGSIISTSKKAKGKLRASFLKASGLRDYSFTHDGKIYTAKVSYELFDGRPEWVAHEFVDEAGAPVADPRLQEDLQHAFGSEEGSGKVEQKLYDPAVDAAVDKAAGLDQGEDVVATLFRDPNLEASYWALTTQDGQLLGRFHLAALAGRNFKQTVKVNGKDVSLDQHLVSSIYGQDLVEHVRRLGAKKVVGALAKAEAEYLLAAKELDAEIREFTDWVECRNASTDLMDEGYSRYGYKEGFLMAPKPGSKNKFINLVVKEAAGAKEDTNVACPECKDKGLTDCVHNYSPKVKAADGSTPTNPQAGAVAKVAKGAEDATAPAAAPAPSTEAPKTSDATPADVEQAQAGTMKAAAESYTAAEYEDADGQKEWAVLLQPANTWVFPNGEDTPATKEQAEAKAAELSKGIKAAADEPEKFRYTFAFVPHESPEVLQQLKDWAVAQDIAFEEEDREYVTILKMPFLPDVGKADDPGEREFSDLCQSLGVKTEVEKDAQVAAKINPGMFPSTPKVLQARGRAIISRGHDLTARQLLKSMVAGGLSPRLAKHLVANRGLISLGETELPTQKLVVAKVEAETRDWISNKIKKLKAEGRPAEQAVVEAYSMARKKGLDLPVTAGQILAIGELVAPTWGYDLRRLGNQGYLALADIEDQPSEQLSISERAMSQSNYNMAVKHLPEGGTEGEAAFIAENPGDGPYPGDVVHEVGYILVYQGAPGAMAKAKEIEDDLARYPLLDEDGFSDLEYEMYRDEIDSWARADAIRELGYGDLVEDLLDENEMIEFEALPADVQDSIQTALENPELPGLDDALLDSFGNHGEAGIWEADLVNAGVPDAHQYVLNMMKGAQDGLDPGSRVSMDEKEAQGQQRLPTVARMSRRFSIDALDAGTLVKANDEDDEEGLSEVGQRVRQGGKGPEESAEDEDFPEPQEPGEEDITIGEDDLSAYYLGKEIVSITRDEADEDEDALYKAISAWCDKQKYWPDVWWISDHGNCNIVTPEVYKFSAQNMEAKLELKSSKFVDGEVQQYTIVKGSLALAGPFEDLNTAKHVFAAMNKAELSPERVAQLEQRKNAMRRGPVFEEGARGEKAGRVLEKTQKALAPHYEKEAGPGKAKRDERLLFQTE